MVAPQPLITPTDGATRYLLFDVTPHEQLNKQRRALMFYLDLAMRLERTLVLPRARLLGRPQAGGVRAEHEYVRWSELFNITTLRKLHPVTQLEAFLADGGPIDRLYRVNLVLKEQGCLSTSGSALSFNGIHGVRVSESLCESAAQYNVNRLQALGQRAIGFSESTDQMQQARALALRPHVRFVQSTYDAAAQFVERAFGGEPFIAVHWRRTDFLVVRRSQKGVLQSAAALVAHVQRVQRATRIRNVYLATDSEDPAELDEVHRALQPVRHPQGEDAGNFRARVEVANIEIAICGAASRFLGTKTSSYTLAILEERAAVFGHADATAQEMDDAPVGTPGGASTASPPPTSPALAIARHGTYLLFDPTPQEQLNQQRRALMFYLDLAMRLERRLVLPRARLLRRAPRGSVGVESEGAEYVRWGELFDLPLLQRLHPVVELEDFLVSHGTIDGLVSHAGCTPTGAAAVGFNGLGVRVGRTICDPVLQHSLRGLGAMPHKALAFSAVADQLQQAKALVLRPNVRFVQATYDAAAQFVAREFGGEPFLAVHWRRTDFLLVRQAQPGVLRSAPQVVAHVHRVVDHVRQLQERTGIRRVFLATDSDEPAEVAEVELALGAVRFTGPADASLRAQAARANLEVAICGTAAHFLGTRTSSFTLTILEERAAVFGHAPATSQEMGIMPLAGRQTEPKQEL